MLIKCYGAAPQGIDAVIVTIEVHAISGFEFTLVGLPDNAVKESHERIVAALTVNGFDKPRHTLTILNSFHSAGTQGSINRSSNCGLIPSIYLVALK